MAGNKKDLHEPDLSLKALDLDSLEDDFDLGIDSKDTTAVRQFSIAFKDGFLEQTRAGALLRRFLKGALPNGYSRVFTGAEDALDTGRRMADEVQEKAAPDLDVLLRQAEEQLPSLRGRMGDKTYDRIQQRLQKAREQNDTLLAPRQGHTQQDQDQSELQASLAALGERQGELEQLRHDADVARDERGEVREALRDQVESSRFNVLSTQLGGLSGHLERQVSYQDNITYKYQRKSLELQYRSYFALRDMRKYAEVNEKLQERAFSALVHNTGLPDHLKAKRSERIRFGVGNTVNNALSMQAAQSLNGFLGNYGSTIRDNIVQQMVSLVSGASNMAANAGMLGSMAGAGGSKAQMAGQVVGDTLSQNLQGTVLPQVARMVQPYLERMGDRFGGGYQHKTSYVLNNLPSILQDYTQDLNQSVGIRGHIQALVRSIVPAHLLDDHLEDGSYQTIDRQVSFNQLTQRSIVEVIPGFLSKILQETRMIRTGRDDIEREVYDVTKGEFSGFKAARDNIQRRVINEAQRRSIDQALTESVDRYDPDQYLSSDARAALRERLLNDAMRNNRFDATQYASADTYASGVDDATRQELQEFFRAQFDFDAEGKLVEDADSRRRLNAFSDALLGVREVVPDPRAEINRLFATGNQEMLRELGLVSNQYGQDRINYDAIVGHYRSELNPESYGRREGPVPRTEVKPDYVRQPGLYEQAQGAAQRMRSMFGFKKPSIEIPKLTDDLVAKLTRLNTDTLAELVHWNPDLIARLKAYDPDIEGRLGRSLERLKGKRKALSRDTIMALVDLANERHGDTFRKARDTVREAATDTASRARDTASHTGENIRDAARRARDAASETARGARETARDTARDTRETARDAASRAKASFDDKTEQATQWSADADRRREELKADLAARAEKWRTQAKDYAQTHGQAQFEELQAKAHDQSKSFRETITPRVDALRQETPQRPGFMQRIGSWFSRDSAPYKTYFEKILEHFERGVKVRIGRAGAKTSESVNDDDVVDDSAGQKERTMPWWQEGMVAGWNAIKGTTKGAWALQQKLIKGGLSLAQQAAGLAAPTAKGIGGLGVKAFMAGRSTHDVYLEGRDEPIMLGRDIRRGRYVDAETKEPILSVDDIKGTVYDTQLDRVAVTKEELAQGIYVKTNRGFYRKAISGLFDVYGMIGKAGFNTLRKGIPAAAKFARDVAQPIPDAYLPGSDQPDIQARLLKRGYYTDEEGVPYYSYSDIDGDVYAPGPQLVVSKDQIHELRRRDGEPLENLGTFVGGALRGAGKLGRKAFKANMAMTRKVLTGIGKGIRGVGRGIYGAGKRLFGRYDREDLEGLGGGGIYGEQSLGYLEAIYQLLDMRLPKPKRVRRGSWQEEFAERAEEAEEAEDLQEEVQARRGGIMGDMHKQLMAMSAAYSDQQERLDEIIDNTDDLDGGMFGGGDGFDIDMDGRDRNDRRNRNRNRTRGRGGRLRRFGRSLGRGIGSLTRGALRMTGMSSGTAASTTARLARWGGTGARMLGSGAMWAGRGALALGSMISGPVALAGAAAVGAGMLGYSFWKNRNAGSGPFGDLRLTQYGFPPGWFTTEPRRLRMLEAYVANGTSADAGGATLEMSRIDPQEILNILRTDTEDEDALLAMGTWFAERFKPVYLSYRHALAKHAPEVSLEQMDSALEAERARLVLDDVTYGYEEGSPYHIMASPFDVDEQIEVDNDDIREKVQAVKDAYPNDTERRDQMADAASRTAMGLGSVAQIRAGAERAVEQGRNAERRQARVGNALGKELPRNFQARRNAGAVASAMVSQRATAPEYRRRIDGQLTSLQAMRLRAYGLVEIHRADAVAMLSLEDQMRDYIKVDSNLAVEFSGSPEEIFRLVAGQFGLDVSRNGDTSGVSRFVPWFTQRFLPTYLAYVGAVVSINDTATIFDSEQVLKPSQKFDVAKAIIAASHDGQSVWDSPHVVFDTDGLADARALAELDYIALQEAARREPVTTESGSDNTLTVNNGELSQAGRDMAVSVGGGQVSQRNRNGAAPSGNRNQTTQRNPWALPDGRSMYGRGGAGGAMGARGSAGNFVTEGNGGVWEQVPMPSRNKSREAAMPTLQVVQQMTGVDANLLATFCSIESSFDYTIKAPTSSATGWFQFIAKTWYNRENGRGVIQQYGSRYQIPISGKTEDQILHMRKDPRINALMGAEFLKSNARVLRNRLGREPTDTDLYAAHFFGAGTAANFLEKDVNALAARHFPEQASANRNIFYSGGRMRTIGEVYQVMDEKIAAHRVGPTQTAALSSPDEILNPGLGPSIDMEQANALTEGVDGGVSSVAVQASSTVNAYNQTQGNTHATPLTTGSVSDRPTTEPTDASEGPATSSTTGSTAPPLDPVISAQAQRREHARQVDRQQREQTARTQSQTDEMGRIAQQQLAVQMEMRDYLKHMAQHYGVMKGEQSSDTDLYREATTQPASTSRTTPSLERRRAPVSMSRA